MKKSALTGLIISACLLTTGRLTARVLTSLNEVDTPKVVRMDIVDVIHKVFKKNFVVDTTQSKEGEPLFSFLPGIGFSQLTLFTIGVGANVSFYISKNKSANISTINFFPEVAQNKQFTSLLISSIWTKNNAYNITGDWRYYSYSIKDYGLGPNTLEAVYNDYDFQFIRLRQAILKTIYPDFLIGTGYSLDYHFKIHNKDKFEKPIVANSDISSKTTSSGISLNVLYDTRRNENSPLAKGWYLGLMAIQNFKFLKSTFSYQSVYLDLRHYISFPRHSKNILAFWNLNWLTLGKSVPYFDLPSTLWDTYDNAGRTYIQGRFRGRNMLYFETEYRFNILRNELLGAAVFANAQNFSENGALFSSKFLPGYGASLRLKLNKKSNVYFVVSYGMGIGGAQGFLFNFGEMF